MFARIEILAEKKLVGKSLRQSAIDDRTPELWRNFMPERKNIKNAVSNDLFNVQVFDGHQTEYTKWAAVEVSDFNDAPQGLETYTLKGGLYAVFIHHGPPEAFAKTFQFIFNEWLPASPYELDNREHFEVLGDKYKSNDPDSEEEVWIPVREKIRNKNQEI